MASNTSIAARLQVFDRPPVRNQGQDPDDHQAGQHGTEDDQQRLGIAHDAHGIALQQQVTHRAAPDRRQGGQDQRPEQRVVAFMGEQHAGERERHDSQERENVEPLCVERLVDQHRHGVAGGDLAKLAALPKFVDGAVEPGQHLWCLRCPAQHEMDVGGEVQRMLFDVRALIAAPCRGRCRDLIGQKAVDYAGQEIAQVLGVGRGDDDLFLVRVIGDEGVDLAVGIDEAGADPEPELLRLEGREHLVDGPERIAAAGPPRQDQDVGLGPVRLGEIDLTAARLGLRRTGRDIHGPAGERRQLIVPGALRQHEFHAHDARQGALDFHVKSGEDLDPAAVVAVLIGIPRIPAAAQAIVVSWSRLRRRDAHQQEPAADHQ
jgi:hypothetical protein